MAKLKELQQQLIDYQHDLTIWESVISDFLDADFISKDDAKATKAMRSPGCIVDRVSESAIERAIQRILDGPVTELKEEIRKLEEQELKPAK